MKEGLFQYVTFYINNTLFGIDINVVQEINRNLDLTRIPMGPACIKGVVNLRGEVVTVLDICVLFNQPPKAADIESRNIFVRTEGELVGISVDQVNDILMIDSNDIKQTPSNIKFTESRLVHGVYQHEAKLVVIIDANELYRFSLGNSAQSNAA